MPHNSTLIERRNAHVHRRYWQLRKKNPKWNIFFVIQEVADEVFLSPVTVSKILKAQEEKVPSVDTIAKQHRETQAA